MPEPTGQGGAGAAAREVQAWLAQHALASWRAWDAAAILQACHALPVSALPAAPDVAHWRALASFMQEGDEALACLELAFQGHSHHADGASAARDAATALVICLIDFGAMDQVDRWLQRLRASPCTQDDFWGRAGRVAAAVLSNADATGSADDAAWLTRQLGPLHVSLSPDERLMAAQLLVNRAMQRGEYALLEVLAVQVEEPQRFASASALMRARWFYTLGFAHYQIDGHERAESAWRAALDLAETHALDSTRFLVLMALFRLLVDRGRADEAAAVERSIQPRWGGGRAVQLMLLHQMRARLRLLQGRPAQAHAALCDALAIADQAGLSLSERASCHTDQAQVLVAQDRWDEAEALLGDWSARYRGRDAAVYACLLLLLRAWRARWADAHTSRGLLLQGLLQAQALRYMMFMRLLPALAGDLCGLALQWQIEPSFVVEVIRKRQLPAPAGAGAHWPWKVWVRMLGSFEIRFDGVPLVSSGKVQRKPLELLQILACERELAIGSQVAMDMLWPDAAGGDPRKNLDMTVQRLRRLLDDAALVRVDGGEIRLNPALVSSDVSTRRLLVERMQALGIRQSVPPPDGDAQAQAQAQCLDLMERILALSAGGLLPGTASSPWLAAERSRVSRELVRSALAAAAVLRHAGAGPAECQLLEAALRLEPLAEGLVLRLMEAYRADGRIADVLRLSEALRVNLRRQGLTLNAAAQAAMQRLLT